MTQTYHHVAACKCASQGIHEDCVANTLVAVALPTIVPAFQLGEEWTASEGHTGSYAVTVKTTSARSPGPPANLEAVGEAFETWKAANEQVIQTLRAAFLAGFEEGRSFEAEARGGSST